MLGHATTHQVLCSVSSVPPCEPLLWSPIVVQSPQRKMNIELLTIGTELLLGFTVDTNAAHIARTLGEIGVRVVRRGSVGDRGDEIRDCGARSRSRGPAR